MARKRHCVKLQPNPSQPEIMADGQDCRGRVLIVGHSFVRRLGDFLDWKEVEVRGHRVTFCGKGGATVATLRAKLDRMNVANFCMVYVEIGTNDLCSKSGSIVASNVWALVAYLRTHGAAQVIFGEVLFRSKEFRGGPSLEEFRERVEEVNRKMKEWMGEREDVVFWRHRRLHSLSLLQDGVHFDHHGMQRYWRSVRGAIITNMHK